VLILGNLFSGFVPNLELIFKASRNNSEMRDIRFKLAIVLKSRGIFRNRTGRNKIKKQNCLTPGIKMEETKPENQDVLERRWNKAGTIFLALVATVDVCLTIVLHWRTYDWINKLLAMVLLLNLALVPLRVIIKGTKEITTRPERWVQAAYIWIIPATILFNRQA